MLVWLFELRPFGLVEVSWGVGKLELHSRYGMDRVSDDVGLSQVSRPLREHVSKFYHKGMEILLLFGIDVSSTSLV